MIQNFPWNTAKMVKILQHLKILKMWYLGHAEHHAKNRTSLSDLDQKTLFFDLPLNNYIILKRNMFSWFPGLTSLQAIPPTSPLKKLSVRYCSITSLPNNLFFIGLEEADFSGNEGEENLRTSNYRLLFASWNCGLTWYIDPYT